MQQPILPSVSDAEFPTRLEAEILNIMQGQSAKLQPQYQAIDWTTAAAAEKLNRAIAPRLKTFGDRPAAVHWVQTAILPKLFQPECLDFAQPDSIPNNLWSKLHTDDSGLASAETEPRDEAQPNATMQPDATTALGDANDIAADPSGIAVLLLDAENLQLKAEEESFLQQHCPYPIQVKLAFANWRKLGKLDEMLHSRSYDLIHVPTGKDHADGKMIAVGSAIHELYPQTRAVLICSSDSIMTNLHSQLAKNQIAAYQVVRADEGLTLSSGLNGDRQAVVLPKPFGLSLAQAIAHLERIVAAECQRNQTPVARFAPVATAFSAQQKLSLKEVVLHYQVGEKALHFLEAYPEKFKLHRLGQPPAWFVELVQEPEPSPPKPSVAGVGGQASASAGAIAEPSPSSQTIQSLPALQAALRHCVKQQISEAQPEVGMTAIAARFRQLYGEPISTALTRFQQGKKLTPFLSNCSEFLMRQDGKQWWIRLK